MDINARGIALVVGLGSFLGAYVQDGYTQGEMLVFGIFNAVLAGVGFAVARLVIETFRPPSRGQH